MTSNTHELYTAGEEILEFARSLGAGQLDAIDLAATGWEASASGTGSVRGSRYDERTQSYAFLTEAEFSAPPLHLACLVREFDVGKLAGQLRDFQLLESSPTRALVEYISTLPWPFQPRWVRAEMRFGVVKSTGALVVLGRSVDGATPPPGATQGTVHYSLYHIRPSATDPGRSVMRRVINVDMHLHLPQLLVRTSLASHYQCDTQLVEQDLAAWEGSALQRRLAECECYNAMQQAMQQAAAAQ